jgi:hypothetical protein
MAPKSISQVVVSLFCFSLLVFGQSSAIEPAATVVHEKRAAGVPLFEFETVQLTNSVVSSITGDPQISQVAKLIAFGDGQVDNNKGKRAGECKTFPGDQNWPKDEIWDEFNSLLGGALISTVPIAAPCYDSEWGPKDLAKCNDIISKFGTPPLQYVLLRPPHTASRPFFMMFFILDLYSWFVLRS